MTAEGYKALDDELKRFYDLPADSVGYRKA